MSKTFSTKLDPKVLHLLDVFCERYHIKKAHLLEEIIREGLRRKAEAMELAESLARGLEDERQGNLISAEDVEDEIFGTKKGK